MKKSKSKKEKIGKFKTFGEFLQAVAREKKEGYVDSRLIYVRTGFA